MRSVPKLFVLLVILSASLLSFPLNLTIKALVPSEKAWYWITNRGIVIARGPPNKIHGVWNVKEITNNVFALAGKADACKVEALALTSVPKPLVYKNATIDVHCNYRYLYSDLIKLIKKGRGIVVLFPLPGETCKEVSFSVKVINNTLILNITLSKIKKWLDICPPSKLLDVIVAWGDANKVRVYVNGKVALVS